MKIVVDAMGGDYAPQAVIAGVVDAVKELDVNIALVGIEPQVREELKKYTYPSDKIEIMHAPEVVDMHEPASTPVRRKKESSVPPRNLKSLRQSSQRLRSMAGIRSRFGN